MVKLTDVDVCSTVRVEGLLSEGYLRERMLALGLTNGALVDVLRKGPKNNLTVYNIRGAMIALRKEESEKIIVSYL
ncbi:ferrous iron transport protein [[Clostridium] sordellii]|uniref:Ferrous iron transport protein n=1 Tax=Paraclostridium sordellii TaxID=1505 RepID=A0A0A1S2C7_PARSO|nr:MULTISPECIES: FeoA family protein [Paeniclostridium]EPZ56394.1 feoA domain protein [[Clostridium] sordellii ATCC 9714] [Paeniclostridium sordellii ATCC 9714]MDU5020591.1 FeoA family protein [Clostridiales bacterium]AUN15049.1 ferrous iron transport protein A [Paeniclostridium sordellii]EPZ59685.1 feoA domain protein [[Clostridium] sordellii VPI 9048] [Paeniclostridium sordellii VPI 9048]MBS6024001.1 ferrous iron transport protein A [Paeniclostridium sordellii]